MSWQPCFPIELVQQLKNVLLSWKWKSRQDGLAWLLSILDYEPTHRATHALLATHYSEVGDKDKAEAHTRMSRGE